MDNIELDRIVNYRAEYSAAIRKFNISGDNLTGLCPFHDDRANSFSVNLKTGQWHCFAEDISGNFISFWAKYYNTDNAEAYKSILEKYHAAASHDKKPPHGSGLKPLTLAQYAADKRFTETWLSEKCHLSTGKDRDGTQWLKIPYLGADGTERTYRKRYGDKQFRWLRGSRNSICLYGLWHIERIRELGYLVLCEGESDAQSLWFMGIPAMGVPGASMFRVEWVDELRDIPKIYIHKDPDAGGEAFLAKLKASFKSAGYGGELFVWQCSAYGVKDPSDLFIAKGRDIGAALVRSALSSAEPVDFLSENIPIAIEGAPIHLRQPKGWMYSDEGIFKLDENVPMLCCRTPVILTKRLISVDTGEEKMEIAFKRDGVWQTAIMLRSVIFQSKSITALADMGCTVTSENAKKLVAFLGALEAENIDVIPREDSTGFFGWQSGNRFIPGYSDGLTLDIDPSQRATAAAYTQNGSMAQWTANMLPHRSRDRFRFILASSFAAPLLRIVKQRIFFVYNWGGSKGGKTAALKAALSAWGDPERLMVSFNATAVGLERTAAFYRDLPLGIDERQLAGNNQGALEKIVYMLSSGMGKIRGAKNGGLQTTNQWRTVALATGEEPIATTTSQTGVSTRMLEIYGAPFDDEAEAGLMHQRAVMDCGWAGPEFVRRVIAVGDKPISEAYRLMEEYVRSAANGKNGSHIAGISVVALADAMIDSWFFGGDHETEDDTLSALNIGDGSWRRAKSMAAGIMQEQIELNSADVNENAAQFIADWILSNKVYFGDDKYSVCYGVLENDTCYIYSSVFNQALEKAGFSPRKTMRYLADKGLIMTSTERTGKTVYSIIHRFKGRSSRFVAFRIGRFNEPETEDYSEKPAKCAADFSQVTLSELEDNNLELPF